MTNPRNVEAVYANHLGASATLTDCTIYFLEIGQSPGTKGPVQKHEVRSIVTIPMLAAQGLIQVLQQILMNHNLQMQELKKQIKSGTE